MRTTYTRAQLDAVKGIVLRPGGVFEAVVAHRTLPRTGKSKRFTDRNEAATWKLDTLADLDSVQGAPETGHGTVHVSRPLGVKAMLETYLDKAPLKYTSKTVVQTLINDKALDIPVATAAGRPIARAAGYRCGRYQRDPK